MKKENLKSIDGGLKKEEQIGVFEEEDEEEIFTIMPNGEIFQVNDTTNRNRTEEKETIVYQEQEQGIIINELEDALRVQILSEYIKEKNSNIQLIHSLVEDVTQGQDEFFHSEISDIFSSIEKMKDSVLTARRLQYMKKEEFEKQMKEEAELSRYIHNRMNQIIQKLIEL